MRTVTLGLATREAVTARVRRAFEGTKSGHRISVASPGLLFKLLSGRRWELIQAMQGAAPMSLREAARRTGRDVKSVHADVHALLAAGILDRTNDGKIVFPFDTVHVDFMLKAA